MDNDNYLNDVNATLARAGNASNGNDDVRSAQSGAEPKLGKAASALFSEATFNARASEGPDLGKILERGELARKGRGL